MEVTPMPEQRNCAPPPSSGSAALPTPAHQHLILAHAAIDDCAIALNAARAEIAKLRDQAQVLVLTRDELRELVLEWAAARREAFEHLENVSGRNIWDAENPDIEAQKRWGAIADRQHRADRQLQALADVLVTQRELEEAAQ